MTEKQRKRAEEVKKYGIDTILDALAMYCEGKNCNECWYINDTDGLCQVLEYICNNGNFPYSEQVPCGEKEFPEDYDY